jgi:two-component system response regulator NreC
VQPIRIYLADDHKLLRQSLRVLLEKEPGLAIVGEAGDGLKTLDQVEALAPDVVLMDISMPHLDGLEATRRIKKRHPDVKVLILSMHGDDQYVGQALRAGASGYLLKDASKEELLLAIRAISQGGSYLSPRLSKMLIDDYLRLSDQTAEDPYHDLLTDREREVFQLMAENQSSPEIGRILGISPKTVRNHRANLMEKLGLHSQSDVVMFALRHGLIPLEP